MPCLCRVLVAFVSLTSAARISSSSGDSAEFVCTAKDVLYAEGAPDSFKNDLVDLSSHHSVDLLNAGVDASALQTCYNLQREQGDWKMSYTKRFLDWMVWFGKGAIASTARNSILKPLLANVLDWKQPGAERLMTWAFDHEDGTNPFCANNKEMYATKEEAQEVQYDNRELFEHFSELLVSGHGDEELQDKGSDLVNEKLGFLITKAIHSTFVADCGLSFLEEGGAKNRLWWNNSLELPPVVQRTFELLKEAKVSTRESFLIQQLVDLYLEYVRINDVDMTNPEMPPEIQPLWEMLATKERVYEKAEQSFKEPIEPSRPVSCKCSHIAKSVADGFSTRLKPLGFDTESAANDWVWRATDREKMMNLFALTEEGIQDPNLSFLKLLQEANRLDRLPTETSDGDDDKPAVSEESAQKSMVKGVLVGLPMLQNYLAHLDVVHGGDEAIKVNYPKKCKWFLFLNIAWAVWHENAEVGAKSNMYVSLKHRQQNVAMGLLVTAMAAVSEFSWDGKLFKETNTGAFNDHNVGLYTVWNYRWVRALFEPRRLQFHYWHGLGLPVMQAISNDKSSAYWVNYRRDGLMAALMNLAPLPMDDLFKSWENEA